jgi:hypothetical protein
MSRDPLGRSIAVVLSVAAAIALPAWRFGAHVGMSAAEFSAKGDATLRAAPWAFGIWSLIYLGLIAYAIYQLAPTVRRSALLGRVGWLSAVGILGCGLWILASAFDQQWLSIAVILVAAGSVITALLRARALPELWSRAQRLLIIAPLALLAGWLTIASGLNIITVLTAQGVIQPSLAWGVGAVLAVLVVGSTIGRRLRLGLYLAPIAWGLTGVAAAERGTPILAAIAAASALVLAVQGVGLARTGG